MELLSTAVFKIYLFCIGTYFGWYGITSLYIGWRTHLRKFFLALTSSPGNFNLYMIDMVGAFFERVASLTFEAIVWPLALWSQVQAYKNLEAILQLGEEFEKHLNTLKDLNTSNTENQTDDELSRDKSDKTG